MIQAEAYIKINLKANINKDLVGVALEDKEKRGNGRTRLWYLEDASGDNLTEFVKEIVQLCSTIRTDDWPGYNRLA